MSAEENKALARRFYAELDRKDYGSAAGDAAMARDITGHMSGSAQPLVGEAFFEFARAFARAFPDFRHIVEEELAEGDRVAVRVTFSGTHTGEFQGMPPTGRRVEVPGLTILRVANGKVVEDWTQFDVMGLQQQLGAMPGATADATAPTASASM